LNPNFQRIYQIQISPSTSSINVSIHPLSIPHQINPQKHQKQQLNCPQTQTHDTALPEKPLKHHFRLIDLIVGFTDSKLNAGDFLQLHINLSRQNCLIDGLSFSLERNRAEKESQEEHGT
jgi:hypothetical protein